MKTLLLALLVCVSLVSCNCLCGSHKDVIDVVKSSKDVYINNLGKIDSLKNGDFNEMLDELTSNTGFSSAESKNDTLLLKIYLAKKERINLAKKRKELEIAKINAIQDSLLKNNTILITRGIKITDDAYDVDLKFEYYESKLNK